MLPIRKKSFFIALVCIGLSLFFLYLAFLRITYPDFDHGDEWADSDVLNSAENYLKFGFIKSRFLPTFEHNLDTFRDPYTHYPALPNVIFAVLLKIFRINSLYFFRGVALFFSYLHLMFWFLLLWRLTNSATIGLLGGVFYLTNPFFIYGMDSLHESSGDAIKMAICLLAVVLAQSGQKKKRLLFALLWFLFFFESLLTFEHVLFVGLFFILYRLMCEEARQFFTFRRIFILFLAPVSGFLLHFLQNMWFFGSFALAFADFKRIAIERVGQSKDSFAPLSFVAWWQSVLIKNLSLTFMFKYYVLVPFFVLAWAFYQKISRRYHKNKIVLLAKFSIIFFCCGVTWYIAFPSHSLAHSFVLFLARHLVACASVSVTLLLYIMSAYVREHGKSKIMNRIPVIILFVAIVGTGIGKSELPVSAESIKRAKDFIIFKQCLLGLKARSGEKDTIGVNYYRNPFIRYYTHRHCEAIFDKATLMNMKPLPRYFIFLPLQDPRSMELLEFLQQRYIPLFQCPSARFPVVVCELRSSAQDM